MRSGKLRLRLLFAMFFAVGCGTRTGLLLLDDDAANPPVTDAGIDRRVPIADSAPPPEDDSAIPPIDATPPPIDAQVHSNCPDAGGTYVYVVTSTNTLYSFYPPDLTFTAIGTLACPSSSSPFSMTVDQKGVAYVVFADGNLFRVSTKTAACAATPFKPGQMGFNTFGMGYAANPADDTETLFIAPDNLSTPTASADGLAKIDTTSFTVSFIGPFVPSISPPELTGTSDGRLFAWAPDRSAASGSHLYQVDKSTGKIVGASNLAVGTPQDAFAFAHWGGQFWIFTSQGASSTVTRYDLATGQETNVASLGETIVGAGVSTCAPSQ